MHNFNLPNLLEMYSELNITQELAFAAVGVYGIC